MIMVFWVSFFSLIFCDIKDWLGFFYSVNMFFFFFLFSFLVGLVVGMLLVCFVLR
jgi:hypothetical protein